MVERYSLGKPKDSEKKLSQCSLRGGWSESTRKCRENLILCSYLVTRLQDTMIIQINNKSFENATRSTHLRTTITNQNCIKKESNSMLNSGNACNHAARNLCFPVCCQNVNIITYKAITVLVILYGSET
jgi:hypothetical protein